jgi:hypothetical protein
VNEGGRREEDMPPGISAGRAGRLRDVNRYAGPNCWVAPDFPATTAAARAVEFL